MQDVQKNEELELENILHREAIKEAGLEYLAQGYSVIPVSPEKRPYVKWDVYNERRATPEEFINWFGTFEDMQLGIVTGELSGITVIDLEVEGIGKYNDLPAFGPMYKTGRGGEHYWTKFTPGVKNGVKVREAVDIRGQKGFVIVPPSKTTHGSYEWKRRGQMLNFPASFLPQKPSFDKKEISYSNIEDYQGCSEGGRNDSMTRYAGRILPEIHPLDWDTIGWQKFVSANQLNNPPLPEDELRRTWESIKSKEKANPSLRKQKKEEVVVVEIDEDNDRIVTIEEAAKGEEINFGEPIPTGIPTLDEALVGGFRPGDLIVLSGQSGEGKTLTSQTITANVAELGIPVIFFTYEVLVNEIVQKFNEMKIGVPGMIYTPYRHSQNKVSWIHNRIKAAKEQKGVKLVVIDHLEFLTTDSKDKNVNLNFSNKVSETVKAVKNIARIEQIAILLLFHLRKINQGRPTLNDAKDSISIIQESDAGIIVERKRNTDGLSGSEFYSPISTLSLQKNRRIGGKTCYIEMSLLNGRLVEIGSKKNSSIIHKVSADVFLEKPELELD